ncbi:uncharacterized protein LACBIDRAFT_324775 [Laccaria bicolor S238N-H82]|uniref:Predicted protein n=1 Tax=Laccaria bicolor (strain S238N-H82 / ATCC MYA-4686) TaxID=486041 RepID=B0D303_LACBS|nr:uncharacterized protein LACBIDRAFT_324775 [Laccaria bicolor S238N-H82]EDR10838.1 predicted protein [Laccaria bicolor S238N-H82]|eukprot:XP_001878139.1 predicted protein [Laccaria bicolor S238N-H82]
MAARPKKLKKDWQALYFLLTARLPKLTVLGNTQPGHCGGHEFRNSPISHFVLKVQAEELVEDFLDDVTWNGGTDIAFSPVQRSEPVIGHQLNPNFIGIGGFGARGLPFLRRIQKIVPGLIGQWLG